MNNCEDILKIVRGNGFTLCLQVEARRADGTAVEDFALQGDEVLMLLRNGASEPKTYERVGNSIFVTFAGTEALGWYGLEMSGEYRGEPWRWSVPKVFQIVETNERAHIPSWTILADDTYIVGCGITLLSEVIHADWAETDASAPSYIKNKPDLSLFYQKPTGGIPASDLSNSVNQSLRNGDDAMYYIQRTADFICSGNRSEIAPALQEACDRASGAVRFDSQQSLTDAQQEQARQNIGLVAGMYVSGLTLVELVPTLSADTIAKLNGLRNSDQLNQLNVILIKANSEQLYSTYAVATVVEWGSVFRFFVDDNGTTVEVSSDPAGNWTCTRTTPYVKPAGGIPYNDLASDVKRSLIHADTALQLEDVGIVYHDDDVPYVSLDTAGHETMIISGQAPSGPEYRVAPSWAGADQTYEQFSHKTTSLSASSTNAQYPSAKAVVDYVDGIVGNIENLLATI